MRSDEYGLGVDIGYRDVVAAVCRSQDDWGRSTGTLGPDGGGRFPTDVRMGTDGRLSLGAPDDPATEGCSAAQAMSRIGVPTPLYVAGRPVSAPDVVVAVVARMREVAEAQEGAPPAWTVLTVPPSWGAHRRGVLADALAAVSGTPVSVNSAAVAVTRSHLAASPLPEHATVVVFDLGASTLDTAAVRSAPGGSIEHLAVPPALPWGGRDVDDDVLGHVSRCLDLPARGKAPAADLAVLRSQCVAAKEALSTDMSVDLTVALPTATRSVRLTREDLDELITDSVAASVDAVRSAVDDAGLTLDDVDGILLAGGGARIPLVAETLSAELGRPLFAASDPALSAAHGAAALALDLGTAGSAGSAGTDGPDSIPAPDVLDTDTSADTDEDGGHALARRWWSGAGAGAAPAGPPRRPAGPPRSRATVRTARRLARGGIVATLFAALLLLPVAVSGLLDPRLVDLTVDRSAADAGEAAPPPLVVPPPGPEQDTAPAAGLSPASAGQAVSESAADAAARTGSSADDEGTAASSRTTASPTTGALPTPAAPAAPGAGGTTVPRAPVPPTTVPPTTDPPTTDPPTTPPTTPPTPPTTPPTTETPPPTTPPADPPTQAPATPPVTPAPAEDAQPGPADSGDGAGGVA